MGYNPFWLKAKWGCAMKNDAICGKNPKGIFTINVLILNPHGSNAAVL
jgi:hypothetical protein